MRRLNYGILFFALLLLLMAFYQPKNAPDGAACPSCPGNMRSSADGMSCLPKMCSEEDRGCPDVSIKCPTLETVAPCGNCPAGWRSSGGSCISMESRTVMPCPE